MARPGALTLAWTSAEAAPPLGWRLSGLYRFDELWVGLTEGPAFDDYASGSGQFAEQALRRLSDRLRARRGPTTGWLGGGGPAPPSLQRLRRRRCWSWSSPFSTGNRVSDGWSGSCEDHQGAEVRDRREMTVAHP